jgi:ATP-dependent RNA helicase DDX31/DBP7
LHNPLLVSDDSKKSANGALGLGAHDAAEATGEEEAGQGAAAGAGADEQDKKFSLPTRLRQYWMPVQCKRRLLSLCAFLRQRSIPSSRPCKAIIFVASVAEVKFLHYMLARAALPDTWRTDGGDAAPERDSDDEDDEDNMALLNLAVSALHGDMAQGERTATFLSFLSADRGILICTDVAARGLDFPKVDWIIQYDPPTDVEEYVHRCGRTARMTSEGDALLFLMPHEEQYTQVLARHGLRLTPLPAASLLSGV